MFCLGDVRRKIRRLKMGHCCCGAALVLLILWTFSAITAQIQGHKSAFRIKQETHRIKGLQPSSIRKLAKKSDLQYFQDVLLDPIMKVRVSGTQANKDVQEHLKNTMTSFKWTIEEDPFEGDTPMGKVAFNNIIATQNPQAPRRLTLACHFDSKYYKEIEFIGATDSAVPCAMLLDLAKSLNATLWSSGKSKVKDVSLQFIFFDGEEAFKSWTETDSIYGARHLANRWLNNKVMVEREVQVDEMQQMDVMVLLDLIGTKDVSFHNWFGSTDKLFERLQKIEMKLMKDGLLEPASEFENRNRNKYFIGNLMQFSGGIEDDHKPFMHHVPVLHLISYPFPKEWHTKNDNLSCLDFTTIDNLNKIMRVFVAEYLHLAPK